ncbi:hypothetical protein [uncultured Alistipes sp.]|uniref:hypothetical protein n=1 Tax=uncultured Alistipes sp. TaxID=538949 RepID=UPI00258A7016|nr:hypothetical protein [uncultured Alistipes sp.]
MKMNKREKFICGKCGLQEGFVDENDITKCPKCGAVIKLAPADKERIKIPKCKFQDNH